MGGSAGLAANGGGGMTFAGAGTTTLTGSNTYSGGTTINGGLLVFSSSSALPATGTITINSPGALLSTGPYSTLNAWLTSGLIATSSSGAIALTANVPTDVNMGSLGYNSLSLGAVGSVTYGGTLEPGSNGYFLGGGGGTLIFTTSLTGTNSLVVGNGGAVVLTTSNTYTGATTVSTGTLQLGTGTAGNDGSLTATSGMTNNGALVYNLAGSQTANYNIIGSGSLTKAGNAGLTLAGANNNYTGTTSVNGGTLNLSGYLNTTGEVMVADAAGAVGTLAVTGTLLANRNANPSLDIGGVTSGVGDLRVFPGAVINTASEFHLGGGATGYGGLTVSGGSITIGSWFLISEGAYGVLNQSGGTINQTGANTVVGCIGSTANIGVANFAGNAAFNTSGTLYLLQNTGANVNGIVSISGSASVTAAAVQFGGNAVNSGDNGILNLNGGTLATASVLLGSNTGASTWTFNFNGGMLKATAGGNFMNGMTSAYVRSGGGTINNNGLSITIGQSLLAPSGSGVSTTSGLTFGGANSGYYHYSSLKLKREPDFMSRHVGYAEAARQAAAVSKNNLTKIQGLRYTSMDQPKDR